MNTNDFRESLDIIENVLAKSADILPGEDIDLLKEACNLIQNGLLLPPGTPCPKCRGSGTI